MIVRCDYILCFLICVAFLVAMCFDGNVHVVVIVLCALCFICLTCLCIISVLVLSLSYVIMDDIIADMCYMF